MGKSQELYERAKTLIPGGTQLLSKRPEMFLPSIWPAYYKKEKGCEVWDLDGKHYFDFAQMGVGSCTLGFADDDINASVISAVENGSMGSLNSYEEFMLAEKLLELHPWADMVRYGRTGGEICAQAIRIARAATSKSIVAFCGYHGWHDWYISSNLGDDKNLDEQLLPGLKPNGVPRELAGTALPFIYNDLSSLQKLTIEHPNQIAAIIMEPQRGTAPSPEFLFGVREIATKIGAVLIFDEVTSGFRVNLGGIHMTLGVTPDLAIFGKALGNGFAISAVIGRKDIMEAAQTSFISSTFNTERIGFAAALATLAKMERTSAQKQLVFRGEQIIKSWIDAAAHSGLDIHVSGIAPLAHLDFNYPNKLAIQTLYTQMMLEKGYLLGASVYATIAYTDDIIHRFAVDTEECFITIKDAMKAEKVESLLKGPIKHSSFARLVS